MALSGTDFIPPAWGSLPPNHRGYHGPNRAKIIRPTLWLRLRANRRPYWILSIALALAVGASGSDAGALFIFILAAAFYFGVKHASRMWMDNHRQQSKQAEQAYTEQIQREWAEWQATRPLALISQAPSPRIAAGEYLARHGTVYLGIDATAYQDFVVAGKRQSVLVIAPAGSGKTLGIAVVAVALHPGPAIFSTTKLDGLRHTARARSYSGRLWLYDPLHSVSDEQLRAIENQTGTRIYRAYWTPLTSVRDWDTAKLTAKGVIAAARYGPKSDSNSHHWDLTAEELLAPMLMAAALHPQGTIDVLRTWIRTEDTDTPLEILNEIYQKATGAMAFGARLAIDNLTSRMLDRNVKHESDVWSTLKTMIQAYEFTGSLMHSHRQNFDPDAFVRSRDTLYVAGNSEQQEFAAPLFVSLLDALYRATTRYDREDPFEESSRPPVLCALDEARNTAPSPYLFRYLSEGLGQGFQTMVFLQSGSQAETVWGREGKSIVDFANIKVLFGGISDPGTLEAFSVLTGDYDREYTTYSTNSSRTESRGWSEQSSHGTGSHSTSTGTNQGTSFTAGSSESKSVHKERRMTPGDLATIDPGEAIVVVGTKWQIVRAGGPLINEWLHILYGPTPISNHGEPRPVTRRVIAGLPSIDTFAASSPRAIDNYKPSGDDSGSHIYRQLDGR